MYLRFCVIRPVSLFLICLVTSTSCGESHNDDSGTHAAAGRFADLEIARKYGVQYMAVDKKKMAHRRRIILHGAMGYATVSSKNSLKGLNRP